eukprot:2751661-Prymnesium_polylepis.1
MRLDNLLSAFAFGTPCAFGCDAASPVAFEPLARAPPAFWGVRPSSLPLSAFDLFAIVIAKLTHCVGG